MKKRHNEVAFFIIHKRFYFPAPWRRAADKARRSDSSAIWRILGANVRIFIVSATLSANRRAMYSI